MNNVQIKINLVFRVVEDKYKISKSQLTGRSRKTKFIKPRYITYALLKNMGLNYSEIARLFERDHSSILYGIQMADNLWKDETILINIDKIAPTDIERMRNPFPLGRSKKWQWLYEIYDGKCIVCGFSDIIIAHHIIPQSIGGTDELSNLVVLCPNHHAMLHHGLVDISKLPRPNSNQESDLSPQVTGLISNNKLNI